MALAFLRTIRRLTISRTRCDRGSQLQLSRSALTPAIVGLGVSLVLVAVDDHLLQLVQGWWRALSSDYTAGLVGRGAVASADSVGLGQKPLVFSFRPGFSLFFAVRDAALLLVGRSDRAQSLLPS